MANNTAISDEKIIVALLECGTIGKAATAAGVSERTIYGRMNNGEFKALYKSAKADMVRAAVFNINAQIGAAVNVIVDIMNDESTNAAVRLQAAQTILNNASKFAQRLTDEERTIETQLWNNKHSGDW